MDAPIVLKRCVKCQCEYPATPVYFFRDKSRKDGLFHLCKPCQKIWKQGEKGKEYERGKLKRKRERHPMKIAARSAVARAIKKGKLPHLSTQLCVCCAQPATNYHHESYERENWIKVFPLCERCHKETHGQIP